MDDYYRSLFHDDPDAVIVADSLGRILDVNSAAEALLGYSGEELRGRPVRIIMPEQYRDDCERGRQRLLADGEGERVRRTAPVAALRKDGSEIAVEVLPRYGRAGDGQPYFAAVIRGLAQAPAGAARHPPALHPGERLADYLLLHEIARGGMGDVWLAYRQGPSGFHKLVALKLIRGDLAAVPSFREMFLNEARIAALVNHPNIVQVFELGESAGVLHLAMEHIDGRSLARVLAALRARGRRLPIELAARIVADASAGLAHAAALRDGRGRPLGLVHCDVSPANLLVTFSGQVKLIDFGLARLRRSAELETGIGGLKGTLAYMAPETLEGAPSGFRTDVYALGYILYEAALGRRPHADAATIAEMLVARQRPPIRPRQIDPTFPAALEAIVLRAIERDPMQRYGDAAALRDDLEAYLSAVGGASAFRLGRLTEELFPPGPDSIRLPLLDVLENREVAEQLAETPIRDVVVEAEGWRDADGSANPAISEDAPPAALVGARSRRGRRRITRVWAGAPPDASSPAMPAGGLDDPTPA